MRKWLLALACLLPIAAHATCPSPLVIKDGNGASQNVATTCPPGGNAQSETAISLHTALGPSATITRPANTTAYAVNEIVCASPCVAAQISLARGSGFTGSINRVILYKSTTGTGGPFEIDLYGQSPNINSSSDQSPWTGPMSADVTGGKWIGRVACNTSVITNEDAGLTWDCALSANVLNYVTSGNANVYAVISTLGSYTPGSAEAFTVVLGALND